MNKKSMATILSVFMLSLLSPRLIWGEGNFEPVSPVQSMDAPQPPLKPQYTYLLYESFEDLFPPEGWLTVSNGTSSREWAVSEDVARTGKRSAVIIYSPITQTMDEWLITPAIDLSNVPDAKLSFYEEAVYWLESGVGHQIWVSTSVQNDLNSFQLLDRMTPTNHQINGMAGVPVEIDLTEFIGQKTVYIAFHYLGSNADVWYVDDITVKHSDAHDVQAVSLNLRNHYDAGTAISPKAKVQNVGLNPESFTVNFGYLNWDGTPVVLNTQAVENLDVNTSTEVVFGEFTPEADIQYEFFAETVLETDQDSMNNRVSTGVNTFTKNKSRVLIEKATGTWCQYCPGSAKSIEKLHENYPDSIVVFEYHGGDSYENAMSLSRIDYYGITGYPTAIFNGTDVRVGGAQVNADWQSVYNGFESSMNRGLQQKTGFSLVLKAYEVRPRILQIVVHTTYDAVSYLKNYRLFLGINESHIEEQWQGMNTLEFVARSLIPDEFGQILYDGETPPYKGMVLSDTAVYRLPTVAKQDNCELIAFIQDPETKEVMVAEKLGIADPPLVSVETQTQAVPEQFILHQNYPNPFNPDTWIEFSVPEKADIHLGIYNVFGQLIRDFQMQSVAGGRHKIHWDGTNNTGFEVASGIYFLKSSVKNQTKMIKLIKMK